MPGPAVTAPPPAFRRAILAWYDATGRSLPFRGSTDPWAILVSETMAQQTQIGRVGPAWAAFMARFPTVADVAAAPPAEVLRAWRGLGYNRRALALQRAARAIVADHGGFVPSDIPGLERLPGVGPYTARAVAAIAFHRPVGAVDTNVRRVLGRVAAGQESAIPPRELQELADRIVPRSRAADWTHAVMDVGATFCRPRDPRCGECPVRSWCRFAASGDRSPVPHSAGARAVPPPRRPGPPFEATTRWLRGRLVDRLRHVDGWTRFEGPIGLHDAQAVGRALAALARDGLVELHPDDPVTARLPTA